MRMLILLILSFCAIDIYASEIFPTGNDIYTACKDRFGNILNAKTTKEREDGNAKNMFCYTAVTTAFASSAVVGNPWAENKEFYACMNKHYLLDVTPVAMIIGMTIKSLEEHPEYRRLVLSEAMAKILHDKYPVPAICKGL